MRVSHVTPQTDPLMDKFCQYSKHEYVDNDLDDGCDLLFCGSVTQIQRAWQGKMQLLQQTGRDVPIVCWVWDLPHNWRSWCRTDQEHDDNMWRDSDIALKLSLLMQCKGILAASEFTQQGLHDHGIESTQMDFYIDAQEIDGVHVEEPHQKRVIQISRYALNKRFDLTIDVWAELQDEFPDWELMFIGTGDVESLRRQAIDRGLKNYTFLEGVARHTTIKRLKESSVLVSPSVFEGWGITPIEAQRCGVYTVCADIPPAEEFLYYDEVFVKDNLAHYRAVLNDSMLRREKDGPIANKIIKKLTPQAFAERFDAYLEGAL